jgi:hypothetical protein
VPEPFNARAILSDLSLGALAGFILGWLDAIQLLLAASSPVIRASQKAPLHILWVSPVMAAPVLAVLAVVLGVAARSWGRNRSPVHAPTIVLGVVSFVVIFLAGSVLGIFHRAAVLLLALGGAISTARLARARRDALDRPIRKGLVASLLVLPVVALLDTIYPGVVERRAINSLPPAAGGDNVIVLVLDTVRWDRFYRSDGVVVAPYLEGLSKEARWYSNAWASSSWSLPSQATLLTGLSPNEHGADWPRLELYDDVVPVAAELARRGVAAAAFSGNDSWVIPGLYGEGFVRFESLTIATARHRSIMGRVFRPIL